MLFKPMAIPNRHETQLAYKLRYFPSAHLSVAAKRLIYKNTAIAAPKHYILDNINEDKTCLCFKGTEYRIVWAHNNIPTEEEWNKLTEDRILTIELRRSPAIAEQRVAIFSYAYVY